MRNEPIIHAVELSKRYKLGKSNYVDALRSATLDIVRGEMAAIMGPSGSGKSTFMHIAGCLDTPDAGEVWRKWRTAFGFTYTPAPTSPSADACSYTETRSP